MRQAGTLVAIAAAVLVAAVSTVGAEDTTLLRRVDLLEREVETLRAQVAALRQAVVISGSDVEVKAAGTLTLSGSSVKANAAGPLSLRGATASLDGANIALNAPLVKVNGGSTPVLRLAGPICVAPDGGGPCTPLPPAQSTALFVP